MSRLRVVVALGLGLVAATAITGCSSTASDTSGRSAAGQDASAVPAAPPKDDAIAAKVPPSLAGKTLEIGTNAPYAPWETFKSGTDQQIIGMDVDLAHAIGSLLGLSVNFQQQPVDGFVPGLKAGKNAMLMAEMNDTPER